ncbi:MAG: Maf family nucleotide pyrophosphatase [Bacteroidales bacterium]|nr:Maf family nucleotide pyrophosphatase [Bacteroidales bacterium]
MVKSKFIKPEYKILLASASPRRRELIAELGFDFSIVKAPESDELIPKNVKREQIAIHLAKEKSELYGDLNENEILVTADTIVWIDDAVLGKPVDAEDAIQMLKLLSGKEHFVFTGVCLRSISKIVSFHAETMVRFANLSDDEILYYVENYKPLDKAGAYGIQEWIGMIAAERIEGSYYNVVGLPVQMLYRELIKF